MVELVENFDGSCALGAASVGGNPSDEPLSRPTSRDVIDGTPAEVPRTISTTNTSVLVRRTSTRSRPSCHRTDDSKEVDGDMPLDPPALLELRDGTSDGSEVVGHYGPTGPHVERWATSWPRRR